MSAEYLIEAVNSPTYRNSRSYEHPYLVICAVLELHVSQEITLPDGSWGLNCVTCDGLTYPCLTIKVLRAELNA